MKLGIILWGPWISIKKLEPRFPGREDDDSKLVHMDGNNVGFQMLKQSALQMLYEDGNSFSSFVRV